MREAILWVDKCGLLWAISRMFSCSYRLLFRLHSNTWKTTSLMHCLVSTSKYTSRRNPSIGKIPIFIMCNIIHFLISFCERNGLVLTNTWFKKPKGRLYTWKAPGDQSWPQLDYILVKYGVRNSMKDVQTMPRADIVSVHNLLVVKMCMRLKKIIKFQKGKQWLDLEKLCSQRQKGQDKSIR